MTTLLLSEMFPPKIGGSGRWFWEIYRRLPRADYLIAAGEDAGQDAFDATHELRMHRLPLTFPTRLPRALSFGHYREAYRRLLALVRAEGVGIVHSGRCMPEGLLALLVKWRTGVPYACYAHGEDVNLSNGERRPRWYRRSVYGSRELGFHVGLVLRNAAFVVANSENTRSILIDRWGLPADRVRLLNPGVDTTRFVPATRDRQVREELGWSDRTVILTVGRLQRRKGHGMMIEALASVREKAPEVLYAIIGDGEERESLQRLVEERRLGEHVQFLSELSDDEMTRCYQQCDLFVLPNREIGGDIEGFGMVLVEAQACGKPVVAGASGGTAETMRIPETGVVVSCDRPDELAAMVVELLTDPARREAMGEAARPWVESRFDWEALTARARELFDDG